ncbi:MAG TPA: glycosyltransferase [Candidatus Acidoferrales bacterium]|nr:glycosyltransferase [Candidatus Acidoferrales bacterium]
MRLLHATQSYHPFFDMGGPTVKVRALARGLGSHGHQVTVITADMGFDSTNREIGHVVAGRWGLEANEDGVEAIYLRTRARYRNLTWNPGVAAFCRERLQDYDLAHIYGLYDLIGPRVAGACRRIAKPYLVEPMGMFRPIVRSIRMKRLYHELVGGRLLKAACRVIATSDRERLELLDGGIADAKIVVRRNGIEAPVRFPPPGSFRDKWGISTNVKLVLFLGRLVSKKSPDLMLEVFSRWNGRGNGSRGSVLVMAGPDEGDGYRQHLEELTSQMGLARRVLFTGPLYGDAKWSAYRDADVFVLPSQNENFGNTAAEAVACGTPVLVTDRCGIAPLVDRRAGLVVPHDCSALEAGLAQILDDPALSARLRGGCEGVASALGWEEPVAQMEDLYRELISG